MIRRHGTTLRALFMLADAVVAVMVVLGVYLLRFALFPGEPAPEIFSPAWVPVVLYAGMFIMLSFYKLTDARVEAISQQLIKHRASQGEAVPDAATAASH